MPLFLHFLLFYNNLPTDFNQNRKKKDIRTKKLVTSQTRELENFESVFQDILPINLRKHIAYR